MDTLKWFLMSSQDPAQVSKFIKGAVTLGIFFGFDQTVVNDAGNHIVDAIMGIGMVGSSFYALYGLYLKWKAGQWSAHKPE